MQEFDRVALWLELKITRQDAEKALRGEPEGTFVIRRSASRPSDYVLSISYDSRVIHLQLKHNNGEMLTQSGVHLISLPQLIVHYRKNKDGLPILLQDSCRKFDPPVKPPKAYQQLLLNGQSQQHQSIHSGSTTSSSQARSHLDAIDEEGVEGKGGDESDSDEDDEEDSEDDYANANAELEKKIREAERRLSQQQEVRLPACQPNAADDVTADAHSANTPAGEDSGDDQDDDDDGESGEENYEVAGDRSGHASVSSVSASKDGGRVGVPQVPLRGKKTLSRRQKGSDDNDREGANTRQQGSTTSIGSTHDTTRGSLSQKQDQRKRPLSLLTRDSDHPELIPYEISSERVHVISELGRGQFGQVFAAWLVNEEGQEGRAAELGSGEGKTGGRLVAVKTCLRGTTDPNVDPTINGVVPTEGGTLVRKGAEPADFDVKTLLLEAATLVRFDHPNVLSLVGIITTIQPLQIITEHMPYGDLKAVLKACRRKGVSVHEHEKLFMMQQIAAGMAHLQSRRFVHRDLAARNILLGHYCNVKIADFGLSRQLEQVDHYYTVRSQSLLPVKWMAPECLTQRKFTHQSDVYALGVCLWEVQTLAKSPWKKVKTTDVTRRVLAGERLPRPKRCPEHLFALMMRCWMADPKERISFQELHDQTLTFYNELHEKVGADPRDIGQLVASSDTASIISNAAVLSALANSQSSTQAASLPVPDGSVDNRESARSPSHGEQDQSDSSISTANTDNQRKQQRKQRGAPHGSDGRTSPAKEGDDDDDDDKEFPREDLRYIRKLGNGTFASFHLMEASSILSAGVRTIVIVKSLRGSLSVSNTTIDENEGGVTTVMQEKKGEEDGIHDASAKVGDRLESERTGSGSDLAEDEHRNGDGQDADVPVQTAPATMPQGEADGVKSAHDEAFLREMETLQHLDLHHENVLQFFGVCSDEEPFYIITEFLAQGSLKHFLNTPVAHQMLLPEKLSICSQIGKGLAYLASKDVVVGDIGARSCLVDSNLTVKVSITGYGEVSQPAAYEEVKGHVLPVRWISPEHMRTLQPTRESDIWAYGVTCWEILRGGAVPHSEYSTDKIIAHLEMGDLPPLPLPVNTPINLQKAIMAAFAEEPSDRPSFTSLCDEINTLVNTQRASKYIGEAIASFDGINWLEGVGEIVFTGYLIKQGGGTGAFGRQNWKRRWFTLRDTGILSYAKSSDPNEKALRIIDLRNATKLEIEQPYAKTFKDMHCFSLHTTTRVFHLVSSSKDQLHAWMGYLEVAMNAYKHEGSQLFQQEAI